MKRVLTVVGILVVVLGVGGVYVKNLLTHQMGTQVATILSTPSVQKEITKALQQNQSDAVTKQIGTQVQSNRSEVGSVQTHGGPPSSVGGSGKQTHVTVHGVSNGGKSNIPSFKNRDDVVKFAMSRFSSADIMHFMTLYLNRSTLTTAEKEQLKQQILSHFSPAEIQAMMMAANRG